MRLIRIFLLFFVICGFWVVPLQAQKVRDYQVVEYDGEQYFLHKVRMGETLFSVAKRFHSDRPTIMNLNPQTINGLKVGQLIKIPYKNNLNLPEFIQLRTEKPTRIINYTIKGRKETEYSIAKKFNISIEELHAYNGSVKDYTKGVQLKIPQWKQQDNPQKNVVTFKKIAQADGGEFIKHKVKPKETLYSLSKQYNISIGDILLHNHHAKNLKVGSIIYVPVESFVNKQENIDLDRYFVHTIQKGETMWSITHEYNVTESELIRLNPELKSGFPVGTMIKIPKNDTRAGSKYISHLVLKQETLYGIAKQYDVSQEAIIELNPFLKKRMPEEGETLLIPKLNKDNKFVFKEDDNSTIPSDCNPTREFFNQYKKYKVALFLPLYGNQDLVTSYTDSTKNINQFYKNSESFVLFYEGVLLALDKMRKIGMNVELNVYDTKKSVYEVKKIVNSISFLSTDLIIGPIYPSVQKEVALSANMNNIPFVSPLATVSNELQNNSNFFQVTPTSDYINKKTAQLILEDFSDRHILVLETGKQSGSGVTNALRKLVTYNDNETSDYELDILNEEFMDNDVEQLKSFLSTEKANVVYLPSTNEGEVSLITSNLNNLRDEYDITVIGSYKYANFKKLEIEHFHNLNMHYIAPYFVDYKNDATIEFVQNFRDNFFTEPNAFAFQGYDIAYFFLNALKNYGKNFDYCIPHLNVSVTQGKYQFDKYNQTQGYMNGGVSVVEYTKDFEVVRKRVIHYIKDMDDDN